MVRIRRMDIARPDVRAELHALIAQCFEASDWQSNRLPKPKTGYCWIAYDGETPCAFALLQPSVRWVDTGYLGMAGVLPKWRGHGLQKKLIRARIRYARQRGWHTVISDTINTNAPSMRSLIACGFRPYNPKVEWADKESSVYWKRAVEKQPA